MKLKTKIGITMAAGATTSAPFFYLAATTPRIDTGIGLATAGIACIFTAAVAGINMDAKAYDIARKKKREEARQGQHAHLKEVLSPERFEEFIKNQDGITNFTNRDVA